MKPKKGSLIQHKYDKSFYGIVLSPIEGCKSVYIYWFHTKKKHLQTARFIKREFD